MLEEISRQRIGFSILLNQKKSVYEKPLLFEKKYIIVVIFFF